MTAGFILAGLFSLALAALFAAGEATLSRFSRPRLAALVRERQADPAEYLNLIDREELLLTAVAARLLFSVLVFGICLWAALSLFAGGPHLALALALSALGALLFVLLFVEVVPKSFARAEPERALLQMLPLLRAAAAIFAPLCWSLNALVRAFGRLFRVPAGEVPELEAVAEVRSITRGGESDGLLQEEQKQMIEGVISLHDVDVQRIMTPRIDMIALRANATVRQANAFFLTCGFSRIPVYQDTLDNIVGILFAKDLLMFSSTGHSDATRVSEIMRAAYFVPETKPVSALLQEMRRHQTHMAIVLDEYGGTAGLVTNEDIVEEIVGEIHDEFDVAPALPIKRLDAHAIETDAQTPVDKVNAALQAHLPESEHYETIGGFLLYHLGRVPSASDTFDHANVHFTVLQVTARRVERLRIELRPESLPAPKSA